MASRSDSGSARRKRSYSAARENSGEKHSPDLMPNSEPTASRVAGLTEGEVRFHDQMLEGTRPSESSSKSAQSPQPSSEKTRPHTERAEGETDSEAEAAAAERLEAQAETERVTRRRSDNALHEAALEAARNSTTSKKKVSTACFLCKTSHSGCDFERPCARCSRLGMAHMCFDTPAKKRGRKAKNPKPEAQATATDEADAVVKKLGSLGSPASAPDGGQQVTSAVAVSRPALPAPSSAPPARTPHPIAPAPAALTQPPATALPTAARSTSSSSDLSLSTSSGNVPLRTSRGSTPVSPMAPLAVVSAVIPHIPTTPAASSSSSGRSSARGRGARDHASHRHRQPQSGNDPDDNEHTALAGERTSRSAAQRKRSRPNPEVRERVLSDVNRLLMDEIQELKADQEKLYEEIRMLRERSSRPPALMSPPSLPAVTHQPDPSTGSEVNEPPKAIVIYDLTKKPVQVMTVNDAFCSMLGYSSDEVLGESWHKFIPPGPYVDRAMSILAPHMVAKDRQGTSTVKFEQVYRHKNGSILRTVDTHNILFGAEGQPTQNFVTISPIEGPVYEDVSLLPPLPMPKSLPALEHNAAVAAVVSKLAPGAPVSTPVASPPPPLSPLFEANIFGGAVGSPAAAASGSGLPGTPTLPSTPSIVYSYPSVEGT